MRVEDGPRGLGGEGTWSWSRESPLFRVTDYVTNYVTDYGTGQEDDEGSKFWCAERTVTVTALRDSESTLHGFFSRMLIAGTTC